ncbi:MAG: hypothetical protein BM564_06450 [Bacteroidetes bacterium MedPE-SWsnd-G2]|nr:MAG: hypothetical protein BM564_06450 [Bacteroidetes bacterium MedPE-SWsnd-G2]
MNNECCNISTVVQDYYDYLKSYIIKKVKDPVVAEDIVQEVMLKLIETHQKTPTIQNIKAWLFQVSRNTIYDYYKRNNIEFSLENESEVSNEDTDISTLAEPDLIVPMISLLPKKYAEPLMLSDIENVPQKDIAEKLNLSLSATKMRIQRGRQKLRDLFVNCCDIEYDTQGNFNGCTIKSYCEPLQNIYKNLQQSTD